MGQQIYINGQLKYRSQAQRGEGKGRGKNFDYFNKPKILAPRLYFITIKELRCSQISYVYLMLNLESKSSIYIEVGGPCHFFPSMWDNWKKNKTREVQPSNYFRAELYYVIRLHSVPCFHSETQGCHGKRF